MQTVTRDGTTLSYEGQGTGEPAILFVHSLGTHEHYRRQIDHFATRYSVIAPDLVGFGTSMAPADRDYTFAKWADDLVWLCEQLDVHTTVVVGHSMSGAIALELAADQPDLVSSVVLLDPIPIVPLPTFREPLAGLVRALQGPQYKDAIRGFAENRQFRATDDSDLRAHLIEDMCAVPQSVLERVFTCILAWDGEQVARRVKAPILLIVQGGTMPADLDRVCNLIPDLELGRTVGAGHWAHVLVPDQVNSMIERFLSIHSSEPQELGGPRRNAAFIGGV